ncbi:MAG: preprotein translocase subunit SecE [Actinomycetota bacterium]
MNRQMKRMQERQERAQKRAGNARPATPSAATRRTAVQEKHKRTGARQFLKEVRQELTKVDWPTRRELVSYSIVVLVTVTVLTAYVFGLDSLFTRFVFDVLGN